MSSWLSKVRDTILPSGVRTFSDVAAQTCSVLSLRKLLVVRR
ncbi:Uncharacterised protein [Sphingomonas paucimobilis]|nr:Uncharacterised protein [Sphingomonas paucimobilis]